MKYWGPLLLICATPSLVQSQTGKNLTIRQSTSGWCSPTIANVTGNVYIICEGVSPEALKALNAELDKSKKDAQERLAEANNWAGRYLALLAELKNGTDPHATQVRKLVDSGKLVEAEQLLRRSVHENDQLLHRMKQSSARQHARLADVLMLELKASDALSEFKTAYETDGDIEFANKYADTLVSQHRCDEARPVYQAAIQQTPITPATKDDEKFQRFHALDGIESCEETAEQFDLAVKDSLENLRLIKELAKNNEKYQPEYINTVMDYAQLERSLGHGLEAASLLSAIAQEIPEKPSSRDEQTERAGFFDVSGATYLVLGDADKAKAVYLEALKAYQQFNGLFSKEGTASDLATLGYIEGLEGHRSAAENYYKQAFDILSEAAKTAEWEDISVASILAGWGQLELQLEDFDTAEQKLKDSLTFARKASQHDSSPNITVFLANDLTGLAMIYLYTGRESESKEAVAQFSSLLEGCAALSCKKRRVLSDYAMGGAYIDEQRWDLASQSLAYATKILEENLDLDSEEWVGLYIRVLASMQYLSSERGQRKEAQDMLSKQVQLLKRYRERDAAKRFPEALPLKLIELSAGYKADSPEFLPTMDDTTTTLQAYWQNDRGQWSEEYGWALLLAGSSHYLGGQRDLACRDFLALESVEGRWQIRAYGDGDFLGHFVKHCKEKNRDSGSHRQ